MKVLIIRRDNIGDLILTTPLISTIAKDMNCKVDLLVNIRQLQHWELSIQGAGSLAF